MLPPSYLEFRLWKQGRVNIENLSEKLKSAVSQASWDIITEYYLLKKSLCVQNTDVDESSGTPPTHLESSNFIFEDEIHFNCILNMKSDNNIRHTLMDIEKPKFVHILSKKKINRYIIQPTPKAKRSITFDDSSNRHKKHPKDKLLSHKPSPKVTPYESGDRGVLSTIYSKYLPEWLEFGHHLNTPSVKKHKITLGSRHLPNIVIGELMNILKDFPKAFRCIPTNSVKKKNDGFYVPFVASSLIPKYVIISRNLDHWHATVSVENTSDIPDFLSPNTLKHTQKFIPEITGNIFIPRQKILWISVENDSVSSEPYLVYLCYIQKIMKYIFRSLFTLTIGLRKTLTSYTQAVRTWDLGCVLDHAF